MKLLQKPDNSDVAAGDKLFEIISRAHFMNDVHVSWKKLDFTTKLTCLSRLNELYFSSVLNSVGKAKTAQKFCEVHNTFITLLSPWSGEHNYELYRSSVVRN